MDRKTLLWIAGIAGVAALAYFYLRKRKARVAIDRPPGEPGRAPAVEPPPVSVPSLFSLPLDLVPGQRVTVWGDRSGEETDLDRAPELEAAAPGQIVQVKYGKKVWPMMDISGSEVFVNSGVWFKIGQPVTVKGTVVMARMQGELIPILQADVLGGIEIRV